MRWVTYIIIAIIALIFVSPLHFFDTGNEPVNYLVRSFYHADATHLIVNLVSLYYLSFIEEKIGWELFLFAIVFIWIVSSMLLYGYHVLVPSQKVYTVGFSAVILGLVVIYYFMMNIKERDVFVHLLIVLVAQLFIPDISVSGHVCGMIAGFIFIWLVPSIKGALVEPGVSLGTDHITNMLGSLKFPN